MARSVRVRAFASALGLTLMLSSGSALAGSGGIDPNSAPPAPVPGVKAKLLPNGLAAPPAGAPIEVQRAIQAANSIDDAGYCTGGGHGKPNSRCYDCSGAVSYALGRRGANILDSPLPSYDFNNWGEPGLGGWITVYYNGGHAFVTIAGLRFDTSMPDDGRGGPGLVEERQGRARERAVQEALLPRPLDG